MKFIKLHQSGRAFLVNLNNVPEVYKSVNNKSWLHLNFAVDDEQASFQVDEPIDEILELIKQVGA